MKAARQAQRRWEVNRRRLGSLRTALGQARQLMASGDEAAPQGVLQVVKIADQAARKRVLHPNAAARHKSRLMKRLHQSQGQSPPSPSPLEGEG